MHISAIAYICYHLIDMPKYGKLAGQILGLLANGFVFGFTKDKNERRKLLEDGEEIWHTIDRKALNYIVNRFLSFGYLTREVQGNKTIFRIAPKGKSRALQYKLDALVLPRPRRWDKKWRMVIFDIPESQKKIRDALRRKLKQVGFLELQKSVFVYPFPCDNEVNFIINFYEISDCVYYLESPITPDAGLKKHFKL